MASHHSASNAPMAAYLYVLTLGCSGLAWEYLRRHPDYQRGWQQRRNRAQQALAWGLRRWMNPYLDAREVHPVWCHNPSGLVQVIPDLDPPTNATGFMLWRLPGQKELILDGRRILLASTSGAASFQLSMAPTLADGMAFLYAVRPCCGAEGSMKVLADLPTGAGPGSGTDPGAARHTVRARPGPAALRELHTLQALDASLAGGSIRDVAVALRGEAAVNLDWHADGALRARIRRLLHRGEELMRGGYRRLAQLPPIEQGRRRRRT